MVTRRFSSAGKRAVVLLLAIALLGLCACRQQTGNASVPFDLSQLPLHVETVSTGASTRNYTPWYIHEWGVEAPRTSNVGGGGPNVMPADSPDKPSGGGAEACCSDIPVVWDPDLRLTVRWLVEKTQDGKTPGYWYKAENVRIPQYKKVAGDLWAVFLPGDRLRIMVPDGREGGNDPYTRPADNDPYIAQGMMDQEWNRLYRDGGNTQ